MRSLNRKSTPRVVNGTVRKKNNWDPSPSYYCTPQPLPVVDRKRPGEGYRHVLYQRDIHQFIALLPDWDELAIGLNAVVLAPGEYDTDGYHVPGAVHICAWEREIVRECSRQYYEDHRDLFGRLGVPCTPIKDGWRCEFTEGTVRAYQLLHILLHELGHHHDRITTRSKVESCRGEPYAEEYAHRYEARIWDDYWKHYSLD